MKLSLIQESAYDDLEDKDQFVDHQCISCGGPLEGMVECAGGCGQELISEVCDSCARIHNSELYCNDCWMTKSGGQYWKAAASNTESGTTWRIDESYEGLEDADEFGEPSLGLCFGCGRDVPEDYMGPWICRKCDAVAHFSCAMPTQEDIRKYDANRNGFTSTGWHYGPGDPHEPGVPFITNANVLVGTRILAATRAYDIYYCPDCAKEVAKLHMESYEGLEDADAFEEDEEDLPIEWRSVYTTRLNGVRGEINLLVDVNNPRRWEVMFDDGTIDERDLSFIQQLATWLGVQWSYRTSYDDLTARVKDKIYLKAYKDNRWRWPPHWGRLWEPPPGYPEPEPPNWYY